MSLREPEVQSPFVVKVIQNEVEPLVFVLPDALGDSPVISIESPIEVIVEQLTVSLGSETGVDLSNYYTKLEVNTLISIVENRIYNNINYDKDTGILEIDGGTY